MFRRFLYDLYDYLVEIAPIALIALGLFLLVVGPGCARADTWSSLGGVSHHFNRSTPHNEENFGYGFETDTGIPHLRVIGGQYKNSFWRRTFYAGASYTPWALGPVQLGFQAAALTGYGSDTCDDTGHCSYHERLTVFGVPMAQIEGKHFGVNALIAPSLSHKGGVVALQFKVKF
ncbi:MAG TPA: hypothetical protein VJS69_14220 [Candidatus Krumholzibacteria bacterium]|nr:hypothetical protein [Candidatus Krumholzibacteria bacterium]